MPHNIGPCPPVHPGEVLRLEFLEPSGLTPYALAKACHVARTRIERLARGEAPVSADTALRLARYFGNTPQFWMNLQSNYDLGVAMDKTELSRIAPRDAA
jgi:addiction module HigA family antidote